MPALVAADSSRARCAQPFIIYRWIDGITLNEHRRRSGADALTPLARSIGRVLGTLATLDAPSAAHLPRITVHDALIDALRRLERTPVRERLGPSLADAFHARVEQRTTTISALDDAPRLVHGDFGGRNIVVRPEASGAWELGGVLDWDAAFAGSPIWDVGSLFRYARRYSAEFRSRFRDGYHSAGGLLPDDWWDIARVIDATRVIRILSEDQHIPAVFGECRTIISDLV